MIKLTSMMSRVGGLVLVKLMKISNEWSSNNINNNSSSYKFNCNNSNSNNNLLSKKVMPRVILVKKVKERKAKMRICQIQ